MTFGDVGWEDMVSLAEKTLSSVPSISPVVSSGACLTSAPGNWGAPTDPTSPCFNYFPIIYFTGDAQFTGGAGQGILLVEGDLKVTGGFEFYGPVFVKGTLTTMGSGGHFWGGVVAANADLNDLNTVLGNAVITYSSCAVTRAILNNSALTKVAPVGHAQLGGSVQRDGQLNWMIGVQGEVRAARTAHSTRDSAPNVYQFLQFGRQPHYS